MSERDRRIELSHREILKLEILMDDGPRTDLGQRTLDGL